MVAAVYFSQIGQNMHIEVDGAGFGPAPTTMPLDGYTNYFTLTDISQGGWTAGGPPSHVALKYISWTDTAIVIDGFGTQYGGPYKVASGDSIAIKVQHTTGPEFTIWTGTLLPGTQPTPVQLISPAPYAVVTGSPLQFSWTPVVGAASYYLQVYLAQAANGLTITPSAVLNIAWQGSTTNASLAATQLLKGTYRWRITAVTNTGVLILPTWTQEQVFTLS